MHTPDTRTIIDAAIRHARANGQFTRALAAAARHGFTLDATPRRTDDPRTLTIPRDQALPEALLEQLMTLAAHLRCRAVDGLCTPVTLHVHPKPQHALN